MILIFGVAKILLIQQLTCRSGIEGKINQKQFLFFCGLSQGLFKGAIEPVLSRGHWSECDQKCQD